MMATGQGMSTDRKTADLHRGLAKSAQQCGKRECSPLGDDVFLIESAAVHAHHCNILVFVQILASFLN
jgi:hypothetical protein